MPEVTRYGQVFYQAEADAMVVAGTIEPCRVLEGLQHKDNHDSSECDYCTVYYDGTLGEE